MRGKVVPLVILAYSVLCVVTWSVFGVDFFSRLHPNWVTMKIVTSVGFFVSSILLLNRNKLANELLTCVLGTVAVFTLGSVFCTGTMYIFEDETAVQTVEGHPSRS